MSNLKFFYNNRLVTNLATIRNGSGGTSPPLDENADFPMSNLQVQDHLTFWKASGAPPDPLLVDWALSTSTTIRALGFANADSAFQGVTDVIAYYSTSVYNAGSPPAFTSLGSIYTGGRQTKLTEFNQASVRALRFEIQGPVAGMKLAKFICALTPLDLGVEHAPGSTKLVEHVRLANPLMGGGLSYTNLGPDRRRWSYKFKPDSTLLANLKTAWGLTSELYMKDVDGEDFQVMPADVQEWARVFVGVYETELNLVQLA